MTATSTPLMVSELSFAIKNQLESRFSNLFVQGEISNFKLHSSGHLYFDLKDSQAKISCVMFKNSIWPGMRLPKEGDSVIIKGALSVYPPHGKYQIIVRKMELAGIGALLARLQELKEKLKAKGYFDKKREIPQFPKTIGVVTSPTGAVIQDILHVLSRRLKKFHLILCPVRVQGEGAAEEIAEAIDLFNKYRMVDVMIVGRGGGSLEDLWPFNEEIVAEAIFRSEIPIISAVGHETDVTIADFVADVRAPTPSAAAELVSSETEKHLQLVERLRVQIDRALWAQLREYRSKLEAMQRHPLFVSPFNILAMPMQRLDELGSRLDQWMHSSFLLRKERLDKVKEKLHALDPRRVLKRGYSILLAQKENSAIISASQLKRGDHLKAVLADGERELVVYDEV